MMGSQNHKWVGRKEYICMTCGQKITDKTTIKRKFCSMSCKAKYFFTGERNPRWKGGISSWKDSVKSTDEYKRWRMKVFQRDRFTCRKCFHRSKASKAHGDKSSDIHAHHIEPMRENKERWFEVDNGITLCVKCHRETYGKEKSFAKVFREILNDYMPNIPKG